MLEGASSDLAIYEPTERMLAGSLTLPYLSGRTVHFVELRVPSNGRLNQEDLRLLWDAGAELASWQQARMALARAEGGFGAPEITGQNTHIRDWRALMRCAHDAAGLLASWPAALDRRQIWQPLGIASGAEDVLTTERFASSRGHVSAASGTLVVTQSARWIGLRRPLTSPIISALALTIIKLIRSSVPPEELKLLKPLLYPIATVARVARAPAGSRDPDPSSWPVAFTSFAASCMRALAELQSAERGAGVVPFLDTDELFEAWLAIETRRIMDARFGPWILPSNGGAMAAWDHDDTRYQLWIKPVIARSGTEIEGTTFIAVVADRLTPDLVLTATRGDETEFMILDAKAWAVMLPEDALSQCAKYLYGIRRQDDAGLVPSIAGVDLVTCALRPAMSHEDLARVHVVTATPTAGTDLLAARIDDVIDQLTASLIERERHASEF